MTDRSEDVKKSKIQKMRSFTSDRLNKEKEESDEENASNNQKKEEEPIGGDKIKAMRERISRKERKVAFNEPELHIIGEIEGGVGFGSGVCCR